MTWLGNFWDSTIGKKIVMAVTGLIGIGFVIGHMLGNLLVFEGAEAFNDYAAFLRSTGGALWAARAVLLLSVILHVVAALQLTRRANAARPVGYARREPQVSTFASRSIRWGGVLLLVFIVYHILHLTLGTVHPEFLEGDVYRNVLVAFRNPFVVAFYVLAMAALALHLVHGAWSSMRTLGASRPHEHPLRRRLPVLIAIVVAVGFAITPLAVLFGVVR